MHQAQWYYICPDVEARHRRGHCGRDCAKGRASSLAEGYFGADGARIRGRTRGVARAPSGLRLLDTCEETAGTVRCLLGRIPQRGADLAPGRLAAAAAGARHERALRHVERGAGGELDLCEPQAKTRPDSPAPSLQGPCDQSLKSEVPCGSCLNWR